MGKRASAEPAGPAAKLPRAAPVVQWPPGAAAARQARLSSWALLQQLQEEGAARSPARRGSVGEDHEDKDTGFNDGMVEAIVQDVMARRWQTLGAPCAGNVAGGRPYAVPGAVQPSARPGVAGAEAELNAPFGMAMQAATARAEFAERQLERAQREGDKLKLECKRELDKLKLENEELRQRLTAVFDAFAPRCQVAPPADPAAWARARNVLSKFGDFPDGELHLAPLSAPQLAPVGNAPA